MEVSEDNPMAQLYSTHNRGQEDPDPAGIFNTSPEFDRMRSKSPPPGRWRESPGPAGVNSQRQNRNKIPYGSSPIREVGEVSIVDSNETSVENPLANLAQKHDAQNQPNSALSDALTPQLVALCKQFEIKLYERDWAAKDAFLRLDQDRSGYVDAGEFAVMLRIFQLDPAGVEGLVAALDVNRDGWIEYHEFCRLVDGDALKRQGPGSKQRREVARGATAAAGKPSHEPVDLAPQRDPSPNREGHGRVQSDVTSPERAGYLSEWERAREKQSASPGATQQQEVTAPQQRIRPEYPPTPGVPAAMGYKSPGPVSPGTETREIRQRMEEVETLRRALESEYGSLDKRLRAVEARTTQRQVPEVPAAEPRRGLSLEVRPALVKDERDAMVAHAIKARAGREAREKRAEKRDPAAEKLKSQMADLSSRLQERFGSIRAAFLHLDTDRSALLDAAEFRKILELYNFEPGVAEAMVAALDTDNDGLIEFYEFVDLLDPKSE